MNIKVMAFVLLVSSYLVYTAWVYTLGTGTDDGNHTLSASAVRGKLSMHRHNCQACHQIYGLGGFMGPDLTNVIQKGEAYVRAFLEHGTDRMPDPMLSGQDVEDVLAYLTYLDSTGHSPLQHFDLTPWGTVVSRTEDGK